MKPTKKTKTELLHLIGHTKRPRFEAFEAVTAKSCPDLTRSIKKATDSAAFLTIIVIPHD